MSASVLVVDDDEKSRRLACDVLAHQGYAMHRAESGEQALAMARSGAAVDLVLLDIQLPGISGVDTFKALREIPGWERVPVIAMTASVMPAERSTLMAEGFDGFLAKPLSLKDLLAAVRDALAATPE